MTRTNGMGVLSIHTVPDRTLAYTLWDIIEHEDIFGEPFVELDGTPQRLLPDLTMCQFQVLICEPRYSDSVIALKLGLVSDYGNTSICDCLNKGDLERKRSFLAAINCRRFRTTMLRPDC